MGAVGLVSPARSSAALAWVFHCGMPRSRRWGLSYPRPRRCKFSGGSGRRPNAATSGGGRRRREQATFAEAFSSIAWAATAVLALVIPIAALVTGPITITILALTWKISPRRE